MKTKMSRPHPPINIRLLKSKMALMDINQCDLATYLGISIQSVSAKLTGKAPLYLGDVERICTLLEITSPIEKTDIFLPESSLKGDDRSAGNVQYDETQSVAKGNQVAVDDNCNGRGVNA